MTLRVKKYLLGAAAALAALLAVRRVREGAGGSSGSSSFSEPVDAYAARDPASGCSPTPKPGVLAFRRWALDKWGERPGSPQNISRECSDDPSEHSEGRAWDLMTNSIAHGDEIVDALLAPDPETGEPDALARRAGIMYLIWNKKMWRAYPHAGQPSGSWAPYSGASPHTDHVHISFSRAGAAGETSLYRQIGLGVEGNA